MDPQAAAAAQALYAKATADMDAKDFASACRKLEEVTRLAPEGLGAKLTLGDCYAALGKLASAWGQYVIVKTAGAQAGQAERAERASKNGVAGPGAPGRAHLSCSRGPSRGCGGAGAPPRRA